MDKYSDIIKKAIKEDPDFQRSLELVRKNSNGKIWVMGSFVFRNIASKVYNLPKPIIKDYDFVVEKMVISPEMKYSLNHFGGLKIDNGLKKTDIWELKETYLIKKNNLNPTIENCLKTASLNIQSIAYDIEENKIIGETSLRGIIDKKILANNIENFQYYVNAYKITMEDYINAQIRKWGFEDFEIDWDSIKN